MTKKEKALYNIYSGQATFIFLIVSGYGAAIFFWSISTPPDPLALIASDPVIYLFGPAYLLIGYGMGRASRGMALLALFYTLLTFTTVWEGTKKSPAADTILFMLLISFFLVRAAYSAFAYHRIMKTKNPAYKPEKTWHLVLGVIAIALVASISGAIIAEETANMDMTTR